VLAGWIHRGYDSQHPDILPAAPECGGSAALADCAKRVKALGYLFGLHDNYQDMYPDAPSWDERHLMRNRDGSTRKGGTWAGGPCWLINSKMGLELARRPQNLPAVKALCAPTAYFTDTTFAAPLFEDFSAEHPLARQDDMRWKRALADYCVELFGFHGSEMGYEWAVPHSHYFEGILSRRPFLTTPPEARLIPLFELVYRDCIALYTHQGDRAGTHSAPYILYHLGLGRMPLYRFGSGLYWQRDVPAGSEASVASVRARSIRRVDATTLEATYEWKVLRAIPQEARAFVHFGPSKSRFPFQNDHALARPTPTWKPGETVVDGPHRFEVPERTRGTFDIRMGLFVPGGGRLPVRGAGSDQRALVGRMHVAPGAVKLLPRQAADDMPTGCFARVDGGFAGTMRATDAFIRNTYEFLSPLNALTATVPMTDHRFLTPDGNVELTRFGDNTTVVINASARDYTHEGTTLPPFGFVVESPALVAFHARNWRGVRYDPPALFVLRSMDGRPLAQAGQVRIYHAFGKPDVELPTQRAAAQVGAKAWRRDDAGRLVVRVDGLAVVNLE
ncbi:hypothetical protein HQ576_08845, partial [bacterium]|nr:hypothetical protein [bacterium]